MKLFFLPYGFRSGSGYGFRVHTEKMLEALERAGADLVDSPEEADLVCHICTPLIYRHFPGKRNLLFTQAEGTESLTWHPDIAKAEILVTSCTMGKTALEKRFKGPVELCPEGVDPIQYPYYQRKAPAPGEKFRILFEGNTEGPRKGWQTVLQAWHSWGESGRRPGNCELYVKGSGMKGGGVKTDDWGVTWDFRDISEDELRDLYFSAHAFVFPSQGEGWGLTLTQALSTGIPALWTDYSAMTDYADGTMGFPITEYGSTEVVHVDDHDRPIGNIPSIVAQVDPQSVVVRLEAILRDYGYALSLGKTASEKMRRYTWEAAAARFLQIVDNLDTIVNSHETARISRLSPEARSAEMTALIEAAKHSAFTQYEADPGRPGALEDAQAWFQDRKADIERKYIQPLPAQS